MSYGTAVQSAVVQCASAKGKTSLPYDRGRFIGGPIAWDESNRRFRDYDVRPPTQADLNALTDEERSDREYLSGVVYEKSLKAAILAWQIHPQDVDLDFWLGPYDREEARRPRRLPTGPEGPKWRIIAPAGNPGKELLHQYNAAPDLTWELSSYGELDDDPCFAVSMFREASYTPTTEDASRPLPYIYTGVTFGGIWHLRFPKWRYAELHRLIGGQWKLVSWKDWSGQDLYGDSYGNREIFVVVMCLDGAILIKSSLNEESWLYALPSNNARAVRVGRGPVTFAGNGGSAYFGLHAVDFAKGRLNILKARSRSGLDRLPSALPASVCLGGKFAGTRATATMYDDQDREISSLSQISARQPGFYTALRLESEYGTRTPVVRLGGVQFPPSTTEPELAWEDLAEDFIEASGGWTLSLEERCVTQSYTIRLSNRSGAYNGWHGNRMVALSFGRPGSEAAGEGSSWVDGAPRRRLTSLAQIVDHNRTSYANLETTLQTISLLEELDEVEIGPRPPLDGYTVAQAFRLILSWCNVGEGQIGTVYDSGHRLPVSSYAMERQLDALPGEVRGALDTEAAAACQLRPELTGKQALRWLLNWDYETFVVETELGQLSYVLPPRTVIRHFSALQREVAEDEIQGEITFRPRLREGRTSVVVSGRERSTGRPLSSRAYDYPALTTTDLARFRGYDRTTRISDGNLVTQDLCNLRCAYERRWMQRVRDGASFSVLGQRLLPLWLVDVGGTQFYTLNVQESVRRDGTWETDVDVVRAG